MIRNSVDRRRDTRSISQFKQDIQFGTARENRLMKAWASSQPGLDYKDNSAGRDGRFLSQSDGKPDFRIRTAGNPLFADGTHLLELKYTPCLWKATLKVADVLGYIGHDASVLLIFGVDKESPRRWTIVTPDQLRLITESVTPRNDHPGMGGKPAVLIAEDAYPIYFGTIHDWS